jgi:hypothetical protein
MIALIPPLFPAVGCFTRSTKEAGALSARGAFGSLVLWVRSPEGAEKEMLPSGFAAVTLAEAAEGPRALG